MRLYNEINGDIYKKSKLKFPYKEAFTRINAYSLRDSFNTSVANDFHLYVSAGDQLEIQPEIINTVLILSCYYLNQAKAACANNRCHAESTCYHGLDGDACLCPGSRTGKYCQTDITSCSRRPCKNGVCHSLWKIFTCSCNDGFTGKYCEKELYSSNDITLTPSGTVSLILGQSIFVTGSDAAIKPLHSSTSWKFENGSRIAKCDINSRRQSSFTILEPCYYVINFGNSYSSDRLYIPPVGYRNSGKYIYETAIVQYQNKVFKKNLFIQVHGPPIDMVISPPIDMVIIPKKNEITHLKVVAGQSITLTCKATAVPLPTITWTCINERGRFEYKNNIIELQSLSLRQTGICSCTARNEYGKLTKDISIVVADVPEPVTNIAITNITNTGFRIKFKSGYIGKSNLHFYQINYAETSSNSCHINHKSSHYKNTYNCNTTDCLINNVPAGRYIVVWVKVATDYGWSLESHPVCILLKGAQNDQV
ncbi:Protocadherin Fat 4 [Trichoplax sp. H2]|nr:Protocadherin Fat 4 [Trichoplax sp. H2]|eukprot:RDD38367.1 Protocadherin Fat 4 [Trichoplax sp. H2]